MALLILGLILFLGPHSIRIFADNWRSRVINAKGLKTWKGLSALCSLAGLILIVYGFGASRADPVFLWTPHPATRWIAMVLTYFAFILLTAADIPRNHIKERLGHPMFAGVKIWAFAHLIANGRLGDVVLFGAFLVWAIAGFSAARRRDRKALMMYQKGTMKGTLLVLVAGTTLYALFGFYLHRVLIGVPLF